MERTAGTSRDWVARAPGGAGTAPLNHSSWRDRVFARMGKISVGGPWCIAERGTPGGDTGTWVSPGSEVGCGRAPSISNGVG